MADLYPGAADSLPSGYTTRSSQNMPVGARQDIPVHPSLRSSNRPPDPSPEEDMMDDGYGEMDDEDEDDEDDEEDESAGSPAHGKRGAHGTLASRDHKSAKTNGGGGAGGSNAKGKAKGSKAEGADGKTKASRGSRACTVCRRLKMRCLPADDGGPPCKRCRQGGHECVFEESQRGKRNTKRTDLLARNLKTMEEKIDFVMSQMQPSGASPSDTGPARSTPLPTLPLPIPGASPSTSWAALHQAANAHSMASPVMAGTGAPSSGAPYAIPALSVGTGLPPALSASPYSRAGQHLPTPTAVATVSAPQGGRTHARFADPLEGTSRPPSPRLHSLPDNTLNPLGLLAEASLHSRHRSKRQSSSPRRRLESGEAANGNASDGTLSDSAQGSGGSRSGSPGAGGPGDADGQKRAKERRGKRGKVGVANQAYFQPGPMNILPLRRIIIEQRMPPSLLTDKVLSSEEAVELFSIYFERCNPHCCILDADLHSPTLIGSRSPFLFTAICAVASKFYMPRRDLHARCLAAAKRCAFDCLVKGYKSVEIVQALLLLSLWNQPAERFEEDRTWAFSGIALRMAQDLNLHRKTTSKLPSSVDDSVVLQWEREILNRERTWIYCFIIDRSLSAQMGKPYSIREDYIIRNSKTWHLQRCSAVQDLGLVAMVDLHRTFTRILDTIYSDGQSVSGINEHLDYNLLMRTFSDSINAWMTEWGNPSLSPHPTDAIGGYRFAMRELYCNYYRLFSLSFILQHSLKNPDKAIELPSTFARCYDAASRVIIAARDQLIPMGALRYAPDNQFVYISYAAVFLLKLIRPEFRAYCDPPAILGLVHDVVELFDKVAIDETHTPALYASFLRVLVTSKELSTAPSRAERVTVDGVVKNDQPTPEAIDAALRRSQLAQDALPAPPGASATAEAPAVPNAGLLGLDPFSDGRVLDGIWETMLMPGYGGGPLDGLSGGTGIVSQYNPADANAFSFTPGQSGRSSPSFMASNWLELGDQDYLGTPGR